MSERAHERQRRVDEIAHAAWVEANHAQADADRRQQQADYDAGPPCPDCYVWREDWIPCSPYFRTSSWHHGPAVPAKGETNPDTDWCRHECHEANEPVWCGVVVLA